MTVGKNGRRGGLSWRLPLLVLHSGLLGEPDLEIVVRPLECPLALVP